MNAMLDKSRASVIPFQGPRYSYQDNNLPPGGGGSMEARVAKLEASVEHIQIDISDIKIDLREIRKDLTSGFSSIRREFFLALIFVALGLAGLLAKGFNWI